MSLATFKMTIETDAENPDVGDIHVVNGQPVFIGLDEAQPASITGVFVAGDAGTQQRVAQLLAQELYFRFSVGRGEWFMDKREGFPWLAMMRGKFPDLRGLTAIFRQTITSAPYVDHVLALTLDLDKPSRSLVVSYTVKALDGSTVQGVLPLIIDELIERKAS